MPDGGTTLRDTLFTRLAKKADAPALISLIDHVDLSGAEVLALAHRGAAALAGMGAKPGDRVLLSLPNSLDLALAYLACLRGRYVAVPVDPAMAPQDVDYVRALARPGFEFSERNRQDSPLGLAKLRTGSAPPASGMNGAAATDLFSITVTSGTTARPKAVAHYAERMLANALVFCEATGMGADTRMLHVMPMHYMAGILNTLLCPLIAGGAAVLEAAFSPRTALGFWRTVEADAVNAVWLSPTMMKMAMRLDRRQGSALAVPRLVFVGTAPLAPEDADAFERRYGTPALHSYGLSELLFVSVETPARRGGVGPLLPGVEVRFAGDGEVEILTDYAFAGYLDPATGAPAENDDVFPSGDLGRFDERGQLFITGRKKDLIVVGGVNVSPVAVEHALGSHRAVEAVAVFGMPDPILGERIVAVLALRRGTSEETLRRELEDLAAALPASARPKDYIFRETLPAGPTGKIMKHVIRRELGL